MVFWLGIVLFIFGLIAVVIFIIVMAHLHSKETKIQVTPNKPEIIIYSKTIRSFTDSYFKGIVKTQKVRKNGTTFIEFFPTDVEQGEGIPIPNLQFFVINNAFIRRFAEGDPSGRRQQIIILPKSKIDLPEGMKEGLDEKWLTTEGLFARVKASLGKAIITQGDEAIQEALKDYSRTGIGKSALADIKESANQFKKVMETPTAETLPEKPKK